MNNSVVDQSLKQLYDQDFYLWIKTTAKLLQDKNFEEIDLENLIEEIESMGRREKRELKNRLKVLLEHLLKLSYWETEREFNVRGWKETIIEQRDQINTLLEDSPSLKPFLGSVFQDCYQIARKKTIQKTGLNNLPNNSPFTLVETLDLE